MGLEEVAPVCACLHIVVFSLPSAFLQVVGSPLEADPT